MAGTQMAIDPNAPKLNRFITLGGEPYLIRYNSRCLSLCMRPKVLRCVIGSGSRSRRPR